MELLGCRVEVWPVAADPAGVWLVTGDAPLWSDAPGMPSDAEPFWVVDELLSTIGVSQGDPLLVHSTSWRVEYPHIILTFIAVLPCDDYVHARWPEALPITPDLLDAAGNPLPHDPAGPPTPRHLDVLLHGVRHLRFLLETDAGAQQALVEPWPTHLAEFQPALAGMYQQAVVVPDQWLVTKVS